MLYSYQETAHQCYDNNVIIALNDTRLSLAAWFFILRGGFIYVMLYKRHKRLTPGSGHFGSQCHNLYNLGIALLLDTTCQLHLCLVISGKIISIFSLCKPV